MNIKKYVTYKDTSIVALLPTQTKAEKKCHKLKNVSVDVAIDSCGNEYLKRKNGWKRITNPKLKAV